MNTDLWPSLVEDRIDELTYQLKQQELTEEKKRYFTSLLHRPPKAEGAGVQHG
jgi:hypothetical protein